MKKMAIVIIASMVIGIGILSGCTEKTAIENKQTPQYQDDEFYTWILTTTTEIKKQSNTIVNTTNSKDWYSCNRMAGELFDFCVTTDVKIAQYNHLSPTATAVRDEFQNISNNTRLFATAMMETSLYSLNNEPTEANNYRKLAIYYQEEIFIHVISMIKLMYQ